MKVRCEKCKTKFDYEACFGKCPACNRYMPPRKKVRGEEGKTQKTEKVNVSEPTGKIKPIKKEIHKKKHTSKMQFFFSTIIISAIIGAMIGAFFYAEAEKEKATNKIRAAKQYTPVEATLGNQQDGFYIKDSYVKVEEGMPYELEKIKLMNGFKYISFPYYMEGKNDYSHRNYVYLKIGELYIRPLDAYNLTEYEEVREVLYNGDLQTYFTGGTGYLVFAVPQETDQYEMYVQEIIEHDDDKEVVANHLFSVQVKEGTHE